MKRCFFLFFLLFTFYLNGQIDVLTCSEGHLPPAVNSTYEQNSNKPYIFDGYGHYYNLEDFSNTTNIISTTCVNSGHFELEFYGTFSEDEVETICEASKYISTLFTSQQTNINLHINKVPSLAIATANARPLYYESNSIGQTECGIVDNLVWEKINTSFNHPNVLTNGIIRFSEEYEWHTLSEDGPGGFDDPNISENHMDMYSVAVHEIMHLLGFVSRFGNSPFSSSDGWYTRWDSFLYGADQGGFLITDGIDENCCSYKEFNIELFPTFPDVLANCPDNLIVFNSNSIATVKSFPTQPNHLDHICDSEDYVIKNGIGLGNAPRFLKNPELDILCTLGYQLTTSEDCGNTCSIIIGNDEFVTGFDEIEITIEDLVQNDGLPAPTDYEIEINEFCGDAPLVMIEDNTTGTGWIISGIAPGSTINLCYTVTGCSGEDCNEGIIEIEYLNIPDIDLTILPSCPDVGCNSSENLFCYGDFEEFSSEEFSEWSYHAMLGLNPCMLVNASTYGSFNQPEIIEEGGNKHMVIGSGNFPGLPAYIENIIVPLTKSIQPDCEITVSFDARQGIGEDTNVEILIYGTEQLPCELIPEEPNCVDPLSNFSCIENSLSITETNWQTISPIIWTNNTGSPINYITITTAAPDVGLLDQRLEIDNLYITENCDSELTITSNVISSCIGDIAEIEYTVCSSAGAPPLSIEVNVDDIVPSLFGIFLSENLGDFIFDGTATIDNIQGGSCETVNLILETDFSLPNDAVFEIQISASSEGACIVNNANTEISFPPILDNADFTFDIECLTAEFLFSNENEVISDWDFGDTETSNEIAPTHSYVNSGTYTVNHTISNECYEVTSTEEITVENCNCCTENTLVIEGNYTVTQAIADGLLLDSPLNYFTSQTIFIDGTLTIDQNYRFSNGSEICMGSGASIAVNSGVYFAFKGTDIHGCEEMWQGIILADDAHVVASFSTIEDAATAVQSGARSRVLFHSSLFQKNMIGILHPPGLSHSAYFGLRDNNFNCTNCTEDNLLPTYPDQQGELGSVSYAGIVINDNATIFSGIGDTNVIQDMPNGIICNNATLNVRDFRFENINRYYLYTTEGYGIISRGHGEKLTQLGLGEDAMPTFDNCLYGIYAQDISVDISENLMQGVERGIIHTIAQTRRIEIQDNTINTSSTGIGLINSDKAALIRIQNNTVTLANSIGANACIWVSELSLGQDEIATIQLNTLSVETKGVGIRMNSTQSYSLIDNTVTISPANPGRGITIRGSKGLTVSCNDVTGSGTNNHIGINALSSPDCDFYSNRINTIETGVRFQGNCNGTDFKTNIFDTNNLSLHMTGTSVMGTNEDPETGVQTHRGNKWIGPGSNAAQHDGTIDNIQLSQFIVHNVNTPLNPTEANPSYVPYTIVSNGDWFEAQPGTPATGNDEECLPKIFQGKATNIDKEIAKENIEIEFYNEQVLWVTKKELYRKLDEDPSQINGDTDLQNFYNTKSSESIGLLYDVEKNSKAIHQVNDSTKGQMESLRNSIEGHLQQLKSLETNLPEEPTDAELLDLSSAQSLIYEELKMAEEQLKNLNQNLRTGKEGAANTNSTQNNSIFVTEFYEQNEKTINEIYLATVAKGNDEFTSSQISELWLIASACPLAGGDAVFKARTLYAMINSEQIFDDDDICNAVGIVLNVRPNGESAAMTNEDRIGTEEEASSSEKAEEDKFSFSLSPNPASDEIRLNIDSSTPLEGIIRFYDLHGRAITEKTVSTGTNAVTIDITDWSDGIYFAKMTFSNGITLTKKVSVVH